MQPNNLDIAQRIINFTSAGLPRAKRSNSVFGDQQVPIGSLVISNYNNVYGLRTWKIWYNKVMEKVQTKVLEISEYLPKDSSGAPIVPVDLNMILKKFGLKAYNTTFKKAEVSGALDRNKKCIYVDSTDPYTRKVFTIAHELGHYFLHDNLPYDILYREKQAHGRTLQEREADEFAAELLMPEATIRAYWSVAEGVQQLAEIFSVSYSAMCNRLRNLGFI